MKNPELIKKQFTIYKELSEKIDRECKKKYITRSQFIIRLLENYYFGK